MPLCWVQRESELRLTLFSCLHLALLAWNLEHGPSLAESASEDTWRATLVPPASSIDLAAMGHISAECELK